MDKLSSERRNHMDLMTGYLRAHGTPRELQHRIFKFYEDLWKTDWAADRVDLFPNMPQILQLQLDLSEKQRIVECCNLFARCTSKSIYFVVRRLEIMTTLADEILYRESEVGRKMFFLHHGTVCKYIYMYPDGKKQMPVRVITDYINGGGYFGQLAFFESKNRHAHSAMATVFCKLLTLSFAHLAELAERQTDIALHIERNAQAHLYSKKEVHYDNDFKYAWAVTESLPKSFRVLGHSRRSFMEKVPKHNLGRARASSMQMMVRSASTHIKRSLKSNKVYARKSSMGEVLALAQQEVNISASIRRQ